MIYFTRVRVRVRVHDLGRTRTPSSNSNLNSEFEFGYSNFDNEDELQDDLPNEFAPTHPLARVVIKLMGVSKCE